jgi:predicted small metal-binding protein
MMIDCRQAGKDVTCSLSIAGGKEEVVRAATLHARTAHGHEDELELREKLNSLLEEERHSHPEPGRKLIDCREHPSDINCSLTLSGREDEVLDMAVVHAVSAHGHADSPELRDEIRSMMREEYPAETTALNI